MKCSVLAVLAVLALAGPAAKAQDRFSWGFKGGAAYSVNRSFAVSEAPAPVVVDGAGELAWTLGIRARVAPYFGKWAVSGDLDYCRPKNFSNDAVLVQQSAVRAALRVEFSNDTAFNATYVFAGPSIQRVITRFTPAGGDAQKVTGNAWGGLVGLGHRWSWDSCSTFTEASIRRTAQKNGIQFGGTSLEVAYGVTW